jgi:hypothetical protein
VPSKRHETVNQDSNAAITRTSRVHGAIRDVDGGQFHGLGYLGQLATL